MRLCNSKEKNLRGLVGCGGWFLSDVFGRDSLFGGCGVGGVEGVGEGLRVRGAYSGYVVPAHLGVQGSGGVAGRAVEEEAGRRDSAVGSERNGQRCAWDGGIVPNRADELSRRIWS